MSNTTDRRKPYVTWTPRLLVYASRMFKARRRHLRRQISTARNKHDDNTESDYK